jgi:hypothetical protein
MQGTADYLGSLNAAQHKGKMTSLQVGLDMAGRVAKDARSFM